MRSVLILIVAWSSQSAFAENHLFAGKYELQFQPYAGYSNLSGFHLGGDLNLLIPVGENWQWKAGGGLETKQGNDLFALNTGMVFNFSKSEDWSRSFYLGAGIAYGNFYRLTAHSDFDDRKIYGYAEFGKRFKLTDTGSVTWNPNLTINSNSFHGANAIINPISFGWSF